MNTLNSSGGSGDDKFFRDSAGIAGARDGSIASAANRGRERSSSYATVVAEVTSAIPERAAKSMDMERMEIPEPSRQIPEHLSSAEDA